MFNSFALRTGRPGRRLPEVATLARRAAWGGVDDDPLAVRGTVIPAKARGGRLERLEYRDPAKNDRLIVFD
jgi:hypothetical protein